ncbi:MAG: NUDIX domain-containing protein [Clostridia bacterium]|nr:NUDIX domain-containing protein [Clostridia bacterium]
MNKEDIIEYCLNLNNTYKDCPFPEDFESVTMKHYENKKWFALLMNVNGKLYLNIKTEPEYSELLRNTYKYIIPAYHMNKEHWNTIIVDDCTDFNLLKELLVRSYELTKKHTKKKKEGKQMNKPIRKAVRCFLIQEGKVLAIKYNPGHFKEGYYDIPGGKIEDGEKPEETAIREMKEETGIDIRIPKYQGIMTVEYPDRKFIFDVFTANEFLGTPGKYEENISEWIEIKKLLRQEKILSCIKILDKEYINGLIDDTYTFKMDIYVDGNENILGVNYNKIQ